MRGKPAVFLSAVLLVAVCGVLFAGRAYADGSPPDSFTYSDNSWSQINAATASGMQAYTKSTGGHGIYTGGGAVGFSGCSAFIQTADHKYDGDTKGRWYTSCSDYTKNVSDNITISKPAQYVGTWIDHSHLKVFQLSNPSNSNVYYDGKIDNGNQYNAQNPPGGCGNNVVQNFYTGGDPRNAAATGKVQVTLSSPISTVNTNCSNPATFPILQFQQTQNYAHYFIWVDSGNIETSDDGTTMAFAQSGSSNVFLDSGGTSCKSQITPDKNDPSHGTLIIRYNGNDPFGQGFSPQITDAANNASNHSGCNVSTPLHVNIGRTANAKKTAGTGTVDGTGPGGGTGGSASSDQLGCDASTNPLSWVICPVVNDLLIPAISWTDSLITEQMVIPSQNIFCSNNLSCNDYYAAWSSFRDLALGLLVVAGMVIIVAQAVGMEILDAYTIRKVLPRLLIAALAITLSWQLMQFAVTVSNNLGFGIRDLLTSPFHNLNPVIDLSFSSSSVVNLFSGFTLLAVGVVASFVAGLGILLSYLATAGLAVLIAIMVLVLRQVVIIMLIILSPVALIAYVLPNTQRVFHLWWESFSKALLMFPLIAAFIAAGRVFAAISLTNVGQNPSPISELIGFVAYFAPYFMIPMTFRMSGAMMSGLGNFVAQRGQAMQGRIGQYRGNQWKGRNEQFRAGTLLEGKRWIPGSIKGANAFNRIGTGVGVGWKGRYGFGRRGEEAMGQHLMTAAGEVGKSHGMQAIAGYNDANRILAEGAGDERRGRQALFDHLMAGGDDGKFGEGLDHDAKVAEANAKVEKAAKAAKAAGGFTKAHAAAALYNMARDGTAIRDTDDLARLAAVAGEGDRNATFTLAANAASMSRQAGRSDLAAASEPIGALAFAHSDRMYKKGLLNHDSEVSTQQMGKLRFEAWKSGRGGENSLNKFTNAKGRTVRNDTRTAVNVLKSHRQAIEAGRESPYTAEQVQFAAANLYDDRMAIANQYGKLNNREDAGKELAKDEGALDWYLGTSTNVTEPVRVEGPHPTAGGAPVYGPPSTRATTNEELVKKIVGDRYASLSPEQRAQMERDAAAGAEEDTTEGE